MNTARGRARRRTRLKPTSSIRCRSDCSMSARTVAWRISDSCYLHETVCGSCFLSTAVPRRAKGSSCPVCLEDLGPDADAALLEHRTQSHVMQASKNQLLPEHSIASKDRIVVAPCSHAVHWSCYASAVRAKSYQAGRCLMCRKAGDVGTRVSAILLCSFVMCSGCRLVQRHYLKTSS